MHKSSYEIVYPQIGSNSASWFPFEGAELKMSQTSLGAVQKECAGVYVLCSHDGNGLVAQYIGETISLRGRLNDDLTWHPLWAQIVQARVHFLCALPMADRQARRHLVELLTTFLKPRLQWGAHSDKNASGAKKTFG